MRGSATLAMVLSSACRIEASITVTVIMPRWARQRRGWRAACQRRRSSALRAAAADRAPKSCAAMFGVDGYIGD